jgi:16S rRNA (cytidine1402-2'-O)-methyltransferase
MAILTLVPTPIGTLEDITLRSLRMLKETDLLFAEDTRVTAKLLHHFEIEKKIIPFHAHNEHKTLERVLDQIERVEHTVLVSDAGTPGISDPGFLLVRAAIQRGIKVSCLPGPTAFVPALVGSGFPCDRFVFEGFLPHKKGRQTKLQIISEEERTSVLYESPHRLVKTLEQMIPFFGPDRELCVVREISKMFETFHHGQVVELLSYFNQNPPKGEIVIIIQGKEHLKTKKKNKSWLESEDEME